MVAGIGNPAHPAITPGSITVVVARENLLSVVTQEDSNVRKDTTIPDSVAFDSNSKLIIYDQIQDSDQSKISPDKVTPSLVLDFKDTYKESPHSAQTFNDEAINCGKVIKESFSNSTVIHPNGPNLEITVKDFENSIEEPGDNYEDIGMESCSDVNTENMEQRKSSLRSQKHVLRNKGISNSKVSVNPTFLLSKWLAEVSDLNTQLGPHPKQTKLDSAFPVTRVGTHPPLSP